MGNFAEGYPVQILDKAAKKAVELLGLNADILEHKTDQYRVDLIQLFVQLDTLMGGNMDDARKWLESGNAAFDYRKPVDLIKSPEGIERVLAWLEGQCH